MHFLFGRVGRFGRRGFFFCDFSAGVWVTRGSCRACVAAPVGRSVFYFSGARGLRWRCRVSCFRWGLFCRGCSRRVSSGYFSLGVCFGVAPLFLDPRSSFVGGLFAVGFAVFSVVLFLRGGVFLTFL